MLNPVLQSNFQLKTEVVSWNSKLLCKLAYSLELLAKISWLKNRLYVTLVNEILGGPDNHVYPPELDNKSEKLKFTPKTKPLWEDSLELYEPNLLIESKWKKRVALFNIEDDPLELEDKSGNC